MQLHSGHVLPKREPTPGYTQHPPAEMGRPAPFSKYPLFKLGQSLQTGSVKVESLLQSANGKEQSYLGSNFQNSLGMGVPKPILDFGVSHIDTKPLPNQNSTYHADLARVVLLAGKCTSTHIIEHLHSLREDSIPVTEVLVGQIGQFELGTYSHVSICIEYDETFQTAAKTFRTALPRILANALDIALHIVFGPGIWLKLLVLDRNEYLGLIRSVADVAAHKVSHFSMIGKYDASTVYITEKEALVRLGHEIQADIAPWTNLRTCDYGENCIRFFPGVKFPDSLHVLNVGGGSALETLAGFKMPPQLRTLDASRGSMASVDYIAFPSTLESLDLLENRIFFLNYVEFPPRLQSLLLSHNNIETLKTTVLPRTLVHFSVSHNPIECIKGARFPESVQSLDLSCIPNESMSGVKFPDSTRWLNLQQSMTNTRGLKLPPFLEELNLGGNGINSIPPLRLPNLIVKLHLGHNNIKSLNKVAFPPQLRELYLGNNMITTLKNVVFPSTLQVLDVNMDPDQESERHITTLRDVVFPPLLRVLRLAHHLIRSLEAMDLPFHLEELSLAYNDLRVLRNVQFGPKLAVLDLSGNQDLGGLDGVFLPESLVEFRLPPLLLGNLPSAIIERANSRQVRLMKSPYEA